MNPKFVVNFIEHSWWERLYILCLVWKSEKNREKAHEKLSFYLINAIATAKLVDLIAFVITNSFGFFFLFFLFIRIFSHTWLCMWKQSETFVSHWARLVIHSIHILLLAILFIILFLIRCKCQCENIVYIQQNARITKFLQFLRIKNEKIVSMNVQNGI